MMGAARCNACGAIVALVVGRTSNDQEAIESVLWSTEQCPRSHRVEVLTVQWRLGRVPTELEPVVEERKADTRSVTYLSTSEHGSLAVLRN